MDDMNTTIESIVETMRTFDDDPEDILFLQMTQREVMLITTCLQFTTHFISLSNCTSSAEFSQWVSGLGGKIIESIEVQKEDDD